MCLINVCLQKFEAYDSSGAVVAGDKEKEVCVDTYRFLTYHIHTPSIYCSLGL